MTTTLKKILVFSASALLIAGVGASATQPLVSARRTHVARRYKARRTHRRGRKLVRRRNRKAIRRYRKRKPIRRKKRARKSRRVRSHNRRRAYRERMARNRRHAAKMTNKRRRGIRRRKRTRRAKRNINRPKQNRQSNQLIKPNNNSNRGVIPSNNATPIVNPSYNTNDSNQGPVLDKPVQNAAPVSDVATNLQEIKSQTLADINKDREAKGLKPLMESNGLMKLAQVRADQTNNSGQLTHYDSNHNLYYKLDAPQVNADLGSHSGENLSETDLGAFSHGGHSDSYNTHNGYQMADASENMMLNHDGPSWGHRNNILDPNFTSVGVGTSHSNSNPDTYYIAEDFAN